MSSIRISPKHGINPSVLLCPVCGKEGSLAFNGLMKGDAEAPSNMIDREPCNECIQKLEEYKNTGFLILVAKDEFETHKDRDKMTIWQFFDRLFVVKRDARFLEDIDTTQGACWMASSTADKLRLTKDRTK